LIGLFGLEDRGQIGWVDGEAAVISLLRRERAYLDGAPDVDFAQLTEG
jgi:hypothetical protein